jgi:hypothetical protein
MVIVLALMRPYSSTPHKRAQISNGASVADGWSERIGATGDARSSL